MNMCLLLDTCPYPNVSNDNWTLDTNHSLKITSISSFYSVHHLRITIGCFLYDTHGVMVKSLGTMQGLSLSKILVHQQKKRKLNNVGEINYYRLYKLI